VIAILENSKAERDFRLKHKKLQQFDYKQATSCSLNRGNGSKGNITRSKKEKEGNTLHNMDKQLIFKNGRVALQPKS
jgi:hypothetical protein